MGYFDEQIKKKNRLDYELFEESYQRLASVVTGSGTWEGFGSSVLLTRSMMDEIAAYLDVGISIPCFSNEEYTARFYMDKYFRPKGIMWREVELKGEWYKDGFGVMLGTLADGRSVALIPHAFKGYTFRDPDIGKTTRVNAKNAGKISKEAILFYRPLPAKELKMGDIISYIRKCIPKSNLAIYALSTIAVILLNMVTPVMTGILFSAVVANSDMQLLTNISVLLIMYRFVSTSSGYKPYWPSPAGACPTEGRVLHRFP